MQFVKTLIWVAIAIMIALFAMRNSGLVTINLWADFQMFTPLWVLTLLAFLCGALPVYIMHRAARWHWRRRNEAQERTIADLRTPTAQPAISDNETKSVTEVPSNQASVAGQLPPSAGL